MGSAEVYPQCSLVARTIVSNDHKTARCGSPRYAVGTGKLYVLQKSNFLHFELYFIYKVGSDLRWSISYILSRILKSIANEFRAKSYKGTLVALT